MVMKKIRQSPHRKVYSADIVMSIEAALESSPPVPTLLELGIEPPADIICIALQSLENATPQTIDFLDIAKFLRAELDNFPGLKTTIIDQVGYTLLAFISE